MYRKLGAILLAILFVLTVSVPSAFALSSEQNEAVKTAYGNTKDKLTGLAENDSWSLDTAWIVLGLARAGELTDAQAEAYYNNVVSELNKAGSAILDKNNSSTNSKTILTLTAAGYDPTDVGGYNLLEPLANLGYVKSQGMNGPVWALLAFNCNNYEIPECENPKAQTTRDSLISSILASQHADGGWSFSMGSDVDMTGMVIQALAPYYDTDGTVKAAVDRGLDWLASVQNSDGAFSSGGMVTSESASQVLVALTSLGIDPAKDERFLKNDRGALDSLLSFYVKGGGFKHIDSNFKYNVLASMQGFYALVAYYRYRDGQNSLYDMTDAGNGYQPDVDYEEEETPPEEDPADDPEGDPADGGSNTDKKDSADSGSSAADAAKKPGGTAKAGGTTKGGSKIALSDKDKDKTPVEHVLEMAAKALERKLPADGSKYDGSRFSEADRIVLLDVYKAYETLNAAEKLAVDKDERWKKYMAAAQALGESWHADTASGVDLRQNAEDALPWYVRLIVDPYHAGSDVQAAIDNVLGEGGELQALYDLYFINMLDGKPWIPDHVLTVRIPCTGSIEGQPVVVHLAEDGKVELLDCSLTEAAGTTYASFSAAEFSPYGVAAIEGSLDEMLAAGGQDEGPFEELQAAGLPWLWIGLGGLGLLALLLLFVLRRRSEEEGSQGNGER